MFPPGTRFGPYEILATLGAGGMGEVYRARDTRLGRDVAIKILPQHLSGQPEVRQRFEREARAVSSLNHPNICVLHDVGSQDGVDYLVLELVEGESLAQRLEKGPLPPDLLLRTAIEIADALDRAHRAGIVHRDLKPGNVMLTRAGAKLMDFGLARATSLAPAVSDLTSSPTMSRPLTAEGTIVGTFQYMAPEQLEGKEADARSDLWAFGATLYEMATGKKAFEARSQASLIAAILEREPAPIASVAPLVPPGLDRLVKACLAKDPEQRLQTAHDAKLQLQWIAEGGSQAGVPLPVATRRRSREGLAWGLAALGLAASTVLAIAWWSQRAAEPQLLRFRATIPASLRNVSWPRLSPDGRTLAFVAEDSTGKRAIWLRPADGFDAHPLPGSESPTRPFWSRDGRQLAFIVDGTLRRISTAGGASVAVGDTPGGADGSWGEKFILYDGTTGDSIRMIPVGGGAVQPATRLDRSQGEIQHAWPNFLPDGRHFLYVASVPGGTGGGTIKLGKVGSFGSKVLGRSDGRVEYAAPGYLVFVREGTLMAQRFDLGSKQVRGEPVPIGESVTIGLTSGDFSVTSNGTLVYRTAQSAASRLVWLDRAGRTLDASMPPGNYIDFDLAPDDRHVVTMNVDNSGDSDLWSYDFERGVMTRLTFEGGNFVWPQHSADGTRLAFASNAHGEFRIYFMSVSASEPTDSLPQFGEQGAEGPADWAPDGRHLLLEKSVTGTSWNLLVASLEGERKRVPFAASRFNERQGRFSPDGRWIAYSSNESGRFEIYVQPFPGPGRKVQVSRAGGRLPSWRRDGRELFFRGADQAYMAAPVLPGDEFGTGPAVRLFDVSVSESSVPQNRIQPSADGQRFLANIPEASAADPGFSFVTNWIADLRRP